MGSVLAHRMMLEATLRGLTKWAPPGPICRQNACMMDLENLKNHKNYVIDAILLQARWSSQQAMHGINRKHGGGGIAAHKPNVRLHHSERVQWARLLLAG